MYGRIVGHHVLLLRIRRSKGTLKYADFSKSLPITNDRMAMNKPVSSTKANAIALSSVIVGGHAFSVHRLNDHQWGVSLVLSIKFIAVAIVIRLILDGFVVRLVPIF